MKSMQEPPTSTTQDCRLEIYAASPPLRRCLFSARDPQRPPLRLSHASNLAALSNSGRPQPPAVIGGADGSDSCVRKPARKLTSLKTITNVDADEIDGRTLRNPTGDAFGTQLVRRTHPCDAAGHFSGGVP